ncbi:hypothetical protein BST81_03210 [Leptolyngbya sp. 'hensonii']|uniref:tRNA (5-methylaminomethyl-2-thiouridine)(34)-methyltransferase MnmD n=1 Tax=Leptolyngbya sp. 'hensonii' TaxID=1922337 RepID=UPI0009502D5F|nr:MnmC family methyltransferase [Leptolyngbya sp. 'hensonii']OLP19856.1 hypothetical protein BST81_03210 [Leptolyngbya sp. 'hensonii']
MSAVGWIPLPTEDGSYTFFSEAFGESFHSHQGAREEALHKFVQAADLPQKAHRETLKLLDVCYGLGYNSAAALETIWTLNPACRIELYALELDATVPRAAIVPPMIEIWSPQIQTVLQAIAQQHRYRSCQLQATLLLGDARQTLPVLCQAGWQADAIFFDPFSPRRCPQLWTVEFFQLAARCLSQDGKLVTYSRSASVRSAMLAAGLQIGTLPPSLPHRSHEWSQGTIGAFTLETLHPLSPLEQEHLLTRASIPYRDPTLADPTEAILERHQQEQQCSTLEATTQWRRRWGIH